MIRTFANIGKGSLKAVFNDPGIADTVFILIGIRAAIERIFTRNLFTVVDIIQNAVTIRIRHDNHGIRIIAKTKTDSDIRAGIRQLFHLNSIIVALGLIHTEVFVVGEGETKINREDICRIEPRLHKRTGQKAMAFQITFRGIDRCTTISKGQTDCKFKERTTDAEGRLKTAIDIAKAGLGNIEGLITDQRADAEPFDGRPFTIEFMIGNKIDIIIILMRGFQKVIIPIGHLGKGKTILETDTPRRLELVIAIGTHAVFFGRLGLVTIIGKDIGG